MKKVIALLAAAAVVFSFSACGSSGSSDSGSSDYSGVAENVKELMLSEVELPDGYSLLLGEDENGDSLKVTSNDDGIIVYVYAAYNFALPYLAEYYLPVAISAIDDAAADAGVDVSLARFYVYYGTDSDDELAYWKTTNGETGHAQDRDGSGNIVNYDDITIEELYDVYADYAEDVEEVISGE